LISWDIIASILTTLVTVGSLAYWLGKKFSQIDNKFEQIDRRFEQVNERFKQIDYRFQQIDKRFEKIDNKFDEMRKEMNLRFDQLYRALVSFNQSTYTTLIDFMTLKGIFTRDEREFLVREVERLSKAYAITNPLKSDEVRFILEVMREIREKDPKEIDLSKLDKILEIADRLLRKEGTREAAELWFKTYMLKAILRKEKGEY